MTRVFYVLLVFQFVACGSDAARSPCPGPDCVCTGSDCTCQAGADCNWTGNLDTGCNESGGSCSFKCLDGNDCLGACAGSCSTECKGGSTCEVSAGDSGSMSCEGSTCTVSLGNSGSVSCTNGSVCHVTCTGLCSVSCSASTCDLLCPGDESPKNITDSGQCS